MKFRKKPIVIEAIQFGPEGTMLASRGDWVIKGINGEFYPVKPDIFEKTYEPVETTTQQNPK